VAEAADLARVFQRADTGRLSLIGIEILAETMWLGRVAIGRASSPAPPSERQ
jgi:hypothetical protein